MGQVDLTMCGDSADGGRKHQRNSSRSSVKVQVPAFGEWFPGVDGVDVSEG